MLVRYVCNIGYFAWLIILNLYGFPSFLYPQKHFSSYGFKICDKLLVNIELMGQYLKCLLFSADHLYFEVKNAFMNKDISF